jgi:hypothetical protein
MAAAEIVTSTPIPPPFFSPYLDDQCGKIQAKGVPWEVSRDHPACSPHESIRRLWTDSIQGYQRAKLVSADELALLKSLNKLVSYLAISLSRYLVSSYILHQVHNVKLILSSAPISSQLTVVNTPSSTSTFCVNSKELIQSRPSS